MFGGMEVSSLVLMDLQVDTGLSSPHLDNMVDPVVVVVINVDTYWLQNEPKSPWTLLYYNRGHLH